MMMGPSNQGGVGSRMGVKAGMPAGGSFMLSSEDSNAESNQNSMQTSIASSIRQWDTSNTELWQEACLEAVVSFDLLFMQTKKLMLNTHLKTYLKV